MMKNPAFNQDAILVVDDDDAVRRLVQKTLQRYDYKCASAANSAEARQLLPSQPFSLILCDIHMPGESGLDLAAFVKTAYPHTAVVMVTVIDDIEIAHQALDMDIYGYMVKPIDRNQILIGVSNALRRRRLEMKEKAYRKDLERKVRDRTRTLQDTNDILRQREVELASRMEELEELNSALRVLLKKREDDRNAIQRSMMANVSKFIKPCLERLKKKARGNLHLQQELCLLEDGLDEMVTPFVKRISSDYFGLTPNEIKVATLIKQGMATKEIATSLNLSENTIMTHRYKIRTKLGIKNKQQNLQVFLKSLR